MRTIKCNSEFVRENHNFCLFSVIFLNACATFVVSLMCSFLILSFLVAPHIHSTLNSFEGNKSVIIINPCHSSGSFCPGNSTEFSDKPCPSGHYCPEGTSRSDEFPCPTGHFNALLSQTNGTACKPCTAGLYCMGGGLSQPTANCRSVT